MQKYESLTKDALQTEYKNVLSQYNTFKDKGLSLDMSRGKPSEAQLNLSNGMFDVLTSHSDYKTAAGVDVRNYGILDGIPEAKALFAEMLGVPVENMFVGGNSSLNLMYDTIARAMSFGICGMAPWNQLDTIKFLCPSPGYDRHFAITESFGFELILIPMNEDGPDMRLVASLVEADDTIKGIWSVPKYSNPTGITYSDDVVRAFANLNPKAADFRIFWDNSYCVHDLKEQTDALLNLHDACVATGKEDMVYIFSSTSKITFSGGGVSFMAMSQNNLADAERQIGIQSIGHDKINQLRHVRFFKNMDGIAAHMAKHRALLAPKFQVVLDALDTYAAPYGVATYTKPNGGYFVSVETTPGCAKRVWQLCSEAGVVLTNAGAPFPYGIDPNDSNIRLAPTFPPVEELALAMELFTLCLRLATLEKLSA